MVEKSTSRSRTAARNWAARDAAKVCWGAMPSTPNMYAAFSAMSMDSTVSVNSSGALY